ncbi:unnamed protein product [Microthlaspi erraticum]|uniref:NYN domain-containing protein n=1 Tax=Microthlaspi erraticum TaxID=1685480 RepID=A0A6D2L475_9BRAS|nr:unnamed protein product [Microthlaspi erraticum]
MHFYVLYNLVEAETAVFWDVGSCPIPRGVHLDTVYENIRSALANQGYRGNVTIGAFGARNKIRDDFFDAGIIFIPAEEEDERDRVDQIMEDVYMWAIDIDHRSKPSNLLIISGDISDDLVTHAERSSHLKCENHNVLIAQRKKPSETLLNHVSFVWLRESLLAGGPPHDHSQVDRSQVDTVVFWDVMDCPVASDIKPSVICDNIRSALKNMGYHGDVSFKAYGPLDKIDFTPLATHVSAHLRTSVMFRDVLESAMKSDSKPSNLNLMILSRDMSEESAYGKAFHFLRSLNHNVLLAHPQIAPPGYLIENVTARWIWETLASGGAPTSSQVFSKRVSSRYDVSQSIAIAVFWDVWGCHVPDGLHPRLIRTKITSALKDNGYTTGRVSFTAYGERNRNWDDFTSAGIMVVPAGNKHARATRIFDDVLTWAKKRREPSNVMIIVSSYISQDPAFVVAFDVLRSLNHNVLLALPQSSSGELPITVAAQWLWETLAAGGPPALWRIPNKKTS